MKDFKQRAPDPDVDSRLVQVGCMCEGVLGGGCLINRLTCLQLQGFLEQMETAMAKHPLWANSPPLELDAATEVTQFRRLLSACTHVTLRCSQLHVSCRR